MPGNVSEEDFDGNAEWNFFWDPSAAKRVSNRVLFGFPDILFILFCFVSGTSRCSGSQA